MGFDGSLLLEVLIRFVALAILSTPATALPAHPADTQKPGQGSGLCFTTWQETYSLLGCYERLGPGIGGEVFGNESTYITLVPVLGNMSTVASCLEGCALAVPRDTASGDYSYVAVSQGRRCRCGTELAERARNVDSSLCDVPCSGDSDVSCGGGPDHALVYALDDRPRTNTTSQTGQSTLTLSCPTPTASPTATSTSGSQPTTSAPCPPRNDTADNNLPSGELLSSADTKSTVGVVLGSLTACAALCGVAILLVFLHRRRQRRRAKPGPNPDDGPSRIYSQTRRRVRDLTSGRAERMWNRNEMVQLPPSTGEGAHRVSHISALISGSEGPEGSRIRQDVSPVDTELSNPASLVVMNASHVVISPVAEGASIIDTRGSPKRRYSLPVTVPRASRGAGPR